MRYTATSWLFAVLSVSMSAACSGCSKGQQGQNDTPSENSLQKFLDSIPKDSQPRADKDGELERIKAGKWIEANCEGKALELKVVLGDIDVAQRDNGYSVTVVIGKPFTGKGDELLTAARFGNAGKVRAGGSDWSLVTYGFTWRNLDESAVKRIRDLKGKTVTFGFRLDKVDNSANPPKLTFNLYDGKAYPSWNGPTALLNFSEGCPVTLDGFDPAKK